MSATEHGCAAGIQSYIRTKWVSIELGEVAGLFPSSLFLVGAGAGQHVCHRVIALIAGVLENGTLGSLHRDLRGPRPSEDLSLIHISEPTRQAEISYAVF